MAKISSSIVGFMLPGLICTGTSLYAMDQILQPLGGIRQLPKILESLGLISPEAARSNQSLMSLLKNLRSGHSPLQIPLATQPVAPPPQQLEPQPPPLVQPQAAIPPQTMPPETANPSAVGPVNPPAPGPIANQNGGNSALNQSIPANPAQPPLELPQQKFSTTELDVFARIEKFKISETAKVQLLRTYYATGVLTEPVLGPQVGPTTGLSIRGPASAASDKVEVKMPTPNVQPTSSLVK